MNQISQLKPSNPASSEQVISTHGRRAERLWYPDNPLDTEIESVLTNICNAHRREVCGFISSDEDVWRINNVHESPLHNFFMDEDDAEDVVKQIYNVRHESIIGIWHTHPTDIPWPSARDLVGWPNVGLGWRYWIVTNSDVIEWRLVE